MNYTEICRSFDGRLCTALDQKKMYNLLLRIKVHVSMKRRVNKITRFQSAATKSGRLPATPPI